MLLRRTLAVTLVAVGAFAAAQIVAGTATTAGTPPRPATVAVPIPAATPATPREPEGPRTITLTVGKGDTLMKMLTDAGVSATEAHSAIAALREHYDPRRMNIGQTIDVHFGDPETAVGEDASRFHGLSLVPAYDRAVRVARVSEDAFKSREEALPVALRLDVAQGEIKTSLYDAATDAGIPPQVLAELIRIFSWDVDFQRDIQAGDTFAVMFERYFDSSGTPVHFGDILHASMTLSGQRITLYRHATADGDADYYDERGRGVRKALLRTPIDGARLSSGFGMRQHPILGYSKMHTGVDFAAPSGTPIYAAGDGVVDKAEWFGGYGRYVRIRHTSEYATAYGHMSGFARGLKSGQRIKQGQVIGYVGSTGRSTGPHLHYEILKGGRHTNPMGVKMPSGRELRGGDLKRFLAQRKDLDARFAELSQRTEVAGVPD